MKTYFYPAAVKFLKKKFTGEFLERALARLDYEDECFWEFSGDVTSEPSWTEDDLNHFSVDLP